MTIPSHSMFVPQRDIWIGYLFYRKKRVERCLYMRNILLVIATQRVANVKSVFSFTRFAAMKQYFFGCSLSLTLRLAVFVFTLRDSTSTLYTNTIYLSTQYSQKTSQYQMLY